MEEKVIHKIFIKYVKKYSIDIDGGKSETQNIYNIKKIFKQQRIFLSFVKLLELTESSHQGPRIAMYEFVYSYH